MCLGQRAAASPSWSRCGCLACIHSVLFGRRDAHNGARRLLACFVACRGPLCKLRPPRAQALHPSVDSAALHDRFKEFGEIYQCKVGPCAAGRLGVALRQPMALL